MTYDALVVAAHPDDAETQMGGTLAKLATKGQRILLVDLSDGEPTGFAARGVRARQAAEAADILGVERVCLGRQDRLITDTPEVRLEVAHLIRQHRPRWVYGTGEACVHPDHAAAASIVRAAVFLARLDKWDEVSGGKQLAEQEAWCVERLFFPHCKMEPAWSDFAFAVDVSEVYDQKRAALAAYRSIFAGSGDKLLDLYEAEDQYFGRLVGVRAEIFRAHSPLMVEDPTVFAPGIHAQYRLPSHAQVPLRGNIREEEIRVMPKTLMIFLATTPYGYQNTETALKLAEAAIDRGHRVILFASADGVHNFTPGQKARGVPNAETGFARLIEKGLRVELCGTCLTFRGIGKDEVMPGAAPSSLKTLFGLMAESDAVISLGA